AEGNIYVYAGGTFIDPEDPSSRVGIKVGAGNRRWFYAMVGHGGINNWANNATDQVANYGAASPFAPVTLAASIGFQGNIRVEADKGDVVVAGGDDFRAHS